MGNSEHDLKYFPSFGVFFMTVFFFGLSLGFLDQMYINYSPPVIEMFICGIFNSFVLSYYITEFIRFGIKLNIPLIIEKIKFTVLLILVVNVLFASVFILYITINIAIAYRIDDMFLFKSYFVLYAYFFCFFNLNYIIFFLFIYF